MEVISRTKNEVTISASKSDMATLFMFLDWIIDNRKVMDDGMIPLQEEEILPLLLKWRNFVIDDLLS